MSELWVTIHEPTLDRALASITAVPQTVAGIEFRTDAQGEVPVDLKAIRAATRLPLIFTRRSRQGVRNNAETERALEAGFDLADVEFDSAIDHSLIRRHAGRLILSRHDYDGMPDVELIAEEMLSMAGHERIKIAVTPRSFADNLRLLALARRSTRMTVIGMGAQGLYSRILAPFFGSELIFVAPGEDSLAAPSQLTLEKAVSLYGDQPDRLQIPRAIYAVIGNPAGHSLSPRIHNAVFRERRVPAAYSAIETSDFEEVAEALVERRPFAPLGLSITAPFKERAHDFARKIGASLTERAHSCRAVNTLVWVGKELVAENTDAIAFQRVLSTHKGDGPVAIIGAGGSARAALWAVREAGLQATVFNRTQEHGVGLAEEMGFRAAPLVDLSSARASVIINTVTAGAEIEISDSFLQSSRLYVDVAYSAGTTQLTERARLAGIEVVGGEELLRLQAVEQSRLFLAAVDARN